MEETCGPDEVTAGPDEEILGPDAPSVSNENASSGGIFLIENEHARPTKRKQ